VNPAPTTTALNRPGSYGCREAHDMGVQRRCGGHRVDVEEVLGPVDRRSDDPAARGEESGNPASR
jgi:hypothetical protein